jgi:cardiolipin synthase
MLVIVFIMDSSHGFTIEGIERLYGRPFIKGNSIKLLWRGTDAFREITRSVEAARKLICLQFYIYRNDETGTELARLLMKKASEGVEVYILYDHLGSIFTPKSFWRQLREAGIKVSASHPFMWLEPRRYQRRDHRKLITIDGETAFTGGLNIANEYRGSFLRKVRPWRDTGILMRGPVAADLTERFFKAWCRLCRKPFDYTPPEIPASGHLPVLPIFASSRLGRKQMRKLLFYSIFHAYSEICLTTAYFIPSSHMVRSLENAVGRGVRVRLLVPMEGDVMPVNYASRHFFAKLLRAGVEIYRYKGNMLHAKSYVFDSQWCIVGSANLDYISLRHNDEGNVGILDRALAENLLEVFETDISKSDRVELEQWNKRPLINKILEGFFALFRRRL